MYMPCTYPYEIRPDSARHYPLSRAVSSREMQRLTFCFCCFFFFFFF